MFKRNKKGVTLLETVIAMVLVSILTISVLSIAISSTSAEGRTKAKYLCINESANILTAFQNANLNSASKAELVNNFENNLSFHYGENNFKSFSQANKMLYVIKFNNLIAPITDDNYEYISKIEIENYSVLNIEFKKISSDNLISIYKIVGYTINR